MNGEEVLGFGRKLEAEFLGLIGCMPQGREGIKGDVQDSSIDSWVTVVLFSTK